LTHLSLAHRRIPQENPALASVADLMEGLVAAYALMAHADGEAAPAERRRIFAILRSNPAMSVFSRDEIANEVASHEANFRYDPELAQQLAREKLLPLAGNRRAAARVVAACRELIPADGVAHPSEYRTLRDIKALLAFDDATSEGFARSIAATQR
jgi:tellurite resistance protein